LNSVKSRIWAIFCGAFLIRYLLDMRLLLINPNTTPHVTQRMLDQARKTAAGRAQVDGATAAFGPAIIGSRVENAIAAHGALDIAARQAGGYDAVILGVSMDTAMLELRDMLRVPVVGMAQAALLQAQMLGQRIGCLTIGPQMIPLYQEMTAGYGLADRVIWHAMTLPAAYGADPGPEVGRAVSQAISAMIRDDGVDVVMLCGAVLTGLSDSLTADIPVIDCIDAATRMAMLLVESPVCQTEKRAGVQLSGRHSTGLGAALAQRLLTGDQA
jgi:allantoin racemase